MGTKDSDPKANREANTLLIQRIKKENQYVNTLKEKLNNCNSEEEKIKLLTDELKENIEKMLSSLKDLGKDLK